ncbi:hypothetical protein CDEST_03829 [Colletotrichum destructivum]|uniref:Uncharacterized protein n=1 Tax=Colletotrichum destructivum TaxID=34406 RepID=A0AAX4I6B7_9PEZI|nr:hypothetical protein CDEST_03829 [Colletotrichum destructivum]
MPSPYINKSTTAVDQRPRYRGNSGRAASSLASLGSPSILGSLLLRKNRRHPVPNPLALARSIESSRPPRTTAKMTREAHLPSRL